MHSIDLFIGYLIQEGYAASILRIPKKCGTSYIVVKDKQSKKSTIVHTSPGGSRIGYSITSNKMATYEIADLLDVKRPQSLAFDKNALIDDVISTPFVRNCFSSNKALVVKPLDSYQSKGVTLGITNQDELAKAITNALAERDSYIVQEHIEGEEIRVTCLNGKAVSVLLRERPHVVGDGKSSIKQLIELENKKREQIDNSLVHYPNLDCSHISKGVDLSYVPNINEHLVLGPGTMIKSGASIFEIMPSTHPSYIEIAEKLTGFLPGGIVSVDLIARDPKLNADGNYSLIEMNTGASLLLYYSCRGGKQTRIIEDHLGPAIIEQLNKKSIYPAK